MQDQKGQELFPFCIDPNGPLAWDSQDKIGKALADYAQRVCGVTPDVGTIAKCAEVISEAAYTSNFIRDEIRVVRDSRGEIFVEGHLSRQRFAGRLMNVLKNRAATCNS